MDDKWAQEILNTLLTKIGYESEVESSRDKEGNILLHITDSQDGALIGYHGENLLALQNILRAIIYNTAEPTEEAEVFIDVANYREERRERLGEMARNSAERARFNATEIALPPMNSSDRREVHLIVSELSGVRSESVGQGRERRVVIIPE